MQQMAFDPVVTFKPQGKCLDGWTGSSEDDLLLGIQTEFQLDMMKAIQQYALMLLMRPMYMTFACDITCSG